MHRTRLARIAAAVAVSALALVGLVVSPASAADGTYAISGTVTHPDNSTFGENEVQVSAYLGAETTPAGQAWTDAAGHYVIPDLGAGTYRVFFDAVDPTLQDSWLGGRGWSDRNFSTTVVLATADQVASLKIYPHGAIKGRVALGNSTTFATTGQVRVEYAPRILVPGRAIPDLDLVDSVDVDADGRFLIPDLESGAWMVRTVPVVGLGFGTSYWIEAGVGMTGQTSDRGTTTLAAGGAMSGHIDVIGQPAGAGEVQILVEDESYGDWVPIAETDADGDFVTIPLITDYYAVRLHYTGSKSVADEWFRGGGGHAYSEREAGSVRFSPTAGPSYSANLQAGADVKGVALDTAGNPVAGVQLEARAYYGTITGGDSYGWTFRTQSGADGKFDLRGLPPTSPDWNGYAIKISEASGRFAVPNVITQKLTVGQQVTTNLRMYLQNALTITLDCDVCASYPYPRYVGHFEKQSSSGSWVKLSDFLDSSTNFFRLGNIVPGTYRFSFTSPGLPTLKVDPFTVAEGQSIDFGPIGQAYTKVGSLTVSGSAKVGSTLTAALGTFTPKQTGTSYAWLRDGIPIAGASESTYVPTGEDLGHTLKAQATVTRYGYTTRTVTSSSTAKVALGTLSGTTPKISGTARVGSLLTAIPGAWSAGADLAYQWRVNGAIIPDATSTTYALRPADVGKKVSVSVAATKDFYAALTKTSASTSRVASTAFESAPVPTISGTPQVGVELTAVPGDWDPAATYSYRWYANRVAISGATHEKFTPTGSQRGKKITVKVTATLQGYTTTSRTSASTAVVGWGIWDATPDVSINGDARVGSRLSADTSGWQSNAAFRYQWYANGSKISGATKSTFAPTSSQLGKTVAVKVTTSTSGYPVWTQTTGETVALAPGQFTATPTPVITGTAKVGSTLKATAGTWAPKATLEYQWYADGVVIANAKATTYKLPSSRAGAIITVTVTASRSAYEPVTLESAGAGPVAP